MRAGAVASISLRWAPRAIPVAGALLLAAAALTGISLVVGHTTRRLIPGSAFVLGLHLVTLAAVGAPLLLCVLIQRQVRRSSPKASVVCGAMLAAILVLVPWSILGRDLVSGEWVRRQSFAPWLRILVPAVGVLSVAGIGALLELLRGRPRGRRLLCAGLVVGGVGLGLVDAFAYRGLYPWPHRIVYLHAGLALLIGLSQLLDERLAGEPRLEPRIGTPAAGVLVLAVLVFGGIGVSPGSTTRAGLLSVAETPAEVVLPWLPRADQNSVQRALARMPTAGDPKNSEAHPWHGRARSVILVVVDNLRADALPPVRGPESTLVKPGDTPFLEQWLGRQFRFQRAYSQASATARSVPAMHRSVQPWEGVEFKGLSLPELASSYGLQSVAVVPEYFVLPTNRYAQSLPEGFNHLEIYRYARQQDLVKKADHIFSGLGDTRFLAWIHFFCVHQPGSFYGHLLNHRDGDNYFRYRRGVQWLDTQMKLLIENLEKRGLADSTAIILAADHGDEKRNGGQLGHGQFVSEQELNVPLAIHIPGVDGELISGPVSNIDLMPTALDLMGFDPHPTHRGRSLLPLLSKDAGEMSRVAYSESASGHAMALSAGRYKLIFSPQEGAYSVFDVERDPETQHNLFGQDRERDGELLAEMVRRRPAVFAAELEGRTTRELLNERLSEVDEDWPMSDIRLLLQLVALSKNQDALAAAFTLYAGTARGKEDSDGRGQGIRMEALSALAEVAPEKTSELIAQEVEVTDEQGEAAFISGLADRGYGEFSPAFVTKHLATLREGPPDRRRAWLRLIAPWKKRADVFLKPLAELQPLVSTDEASLSLWLQSLATLDAKSNQAGKRHPLSPTLGDQIERFLRHEKGRVRLEAARALGVLGGTKGVEGLRRLLEQRHVDLPTHEAALVSLVALQGRDAMDVLLAQNPRSPHVLTVVRVIDQLEDPRGIPMLQKIRRVSTSQMSRIEAGEVLKRSGKWEKRDPEAQNAPPPR